MRIEIYVDTTCPWCFIGKRRLERALRLRPRFNVNLRWRAFQLNPALPEKGIDRESYLKAKFGSAVRIHRHHEALLQAGAEEGIDFHLDRIKYTPNTLKSHRLMAAAFKIAAQSDLLESLFGAYFLDGLDIGDDETLREIATNIGLSDKEIAFAFDPLELQREMNAARIAEELKPRMGLDGVPFFLFNGTFGLAGAQEAETLAALLDLAYEDDDRRRSLGIEHKD